MIHHRLLPEYIITQFGLYMIGWLVCPFSILLNLAPVIIFSCPGPDLEPFIFSVAADLVSSDLINALILEMYSTLLLEEMKYEKDYYSHPAIMIYFFCSGRAFVFLHVIYLSSVAGSSLMQFRVIINSVSFCWCCRADRKTVGQPWKKINK